MILPIYLYGQPVLKKMAEDISADYPGFSQLLADMWETMYNASGVGLAAPQVGLSIRLFVVDTTQIKSEHKPGEEGFKKVFINAYKIEENGKNWSYEEGCLSIPDIRGEVERPSTIQLQYLDENFVLHQQTFVGINARVIQHEYDHIDGILFTEKLKPIKKRLVQKRLDNIAKGSVKADYKVKSPVRSR